MQKKINYISDNNIRDEALNISKSFIVQAPAGSGKTTLLLNRYLKLLTTAITPESILVITFTNKAVAELKSRIINILHTTSSPQPTHTITKHQEQTYHLAQQVLTRSNELDWGLLVNQSRLKIMTIDGLAHTIVASSSFVNNNILTDDKRNYIYYKSVQDVLKLINIKQYNHDIITTLTYLDNDCEMFIRLIELMLRKRDQWLRLTNNSIINSNKLIKTLTDTSNIIIGEALEAILINLDNVELSFLEQLILSSPKLSDKSKSIFSANSSVSNADIIYFIELKQLLLTKDLKIRANILGFTKAKFSAEIELFTINKDILQKSKFLALLSKIEVLPDNNFNQEDNKIIPVLARILNLAVAQLTLNFAKEQATDFTDITLKASSILADDENPSDFSMYLDNKIEHILLDEFQDTSYSHFELLSSLIKFWQKDDGRTIFLVGDPMQSIYRFREAQVELFLQVQKYGINNITLTPLTLRCNFRSSFAVVNANNKLFSSIFPKESHSETGAISYSQSVATYDDNNKKPIKFYPYKQDDGTAEAQQVLDIINIEQRNNKEHKIAILVRARAHLKHIIPILVANNISFEAINITKLSANNYTKDLLSLTKAIINLGDKLSWLSILRAPWCGLLLADLLLVSNDEYKTVWQALHSEEVINKLTTNGAQRVAKFCQIMQVILAKKDNFNFAIILESALSRLNFMSYTSADDNNIKNKFLEAVMTIENNNYSLDINLLEQKINTSFIDIKNNSNNNPVQIMTLFNAKGLEFDVVIMPSLGKIPPPTAKDILLFKAFSEGILFAPISIGNSSDSQTYKYLRSLAKQQDNYELMRVLYVAMTRAKRQLYLLANNNTNRPRSNSLLYYLWDYYGYTFDNIAEIEQEITPKQTPKLYRVPQLPDFVNVNNSALNTTKSINLELNYYKELGTIIHYYLEHEFFKPTDNAILAKLKTSGIASNQLITSLQYIKLLLQNISKSQHFNWLFKKRSSTIVENIFYQQSSKNIIVDRVFIDKGTVWIIDYKTSRITDNESLADFLLRQHKDYSKQMLNYKQILANYYQQPIKTALYLLAVDELLEIN